MRKTLFLSLALAALAFAACNNNTSVKSAGSVVPSPDSGSVQKEVYVASDSVLVLSPDGQMGAYVKTRIGSTPATEENNTDIDEIWLYDVSSNTTSILVRGNENASTPETTLESLGSLAFSPDGQYLYFTTEAWTTSGAIHRVDLETEKEKFVSAGNGLEVVPSGKYKGFLITSLHKYFDGGGSYDYYYLLSMDGKEVMLAGKDDDAKDKFLARYK